MQVDRLDVELVARGPWESQDLGLQLLRRHARTTYGTLAVVCLPVWLLLLALDGRSPALSLIAIWWLKPAMDRVVLLVLSPAVFGAAPTIRAALSALPTIFDRHLLAALTWQRLSLRRSLLMPTACLENQRGKALSKRLGVLSRGETHSAATLSTWVYLHVEGALALAGFLLVLTFLPAGLLPSFQELFALEGASLPPLLNWISTLTWLPAVFWIEPAFVAAGFGLYLSSRTRLEGWDVELSFRGLARRLAQRTRSGLTAMILVCSAASVLSPRVQAQETSDPQQVARQILESDPTFATTAEREVLVPTGSLGGSTTGSGSAIAQIFAVTIKLVAIGGLVVAVVLAIAHVARRKPGVGSARREPAQPRPDEAFGLDLRPASLPTDIAASAASLIAAGEVTAALSLLYRGALSRLIDRDGLVIGVGDTERDCLERVAQGDLGAQAEYFERLTHGWLRAAWAARPPAPNEALALSKDWSRAFGGRR